MDDYTAYENAKTIILNSNNFYMGVFSNYKVEGSYITANDFPLVVKGFSTSAHYWEILNALNPS